ncbi:MAG: DegT/DnrJ/EryC1/StrS family aminotransferase [Planctomycetes bacterium]|nr:DegT/DnrJ/EryC1/StrS family aminotransferase [Planctomycetota bacterium]
MGGAAGAGDRTTGVTSPPIAAPVEIPLSRPDITDLERRMVMAVLERPTLSIGPELAAFEAGIARLTGTRHAVGVSSGTAGLHLAVRALDLGPGDEVVTTPFSFIASANCLLYEGVRPVFADIDPDTLNLDPRAAESAVGPNCRGILVVHVFGRPADMEAFGRIAGRRGLAIVEDACEALGARTPCGTAGAVGEAGVFAFYPNKQITSGEGGMLVTDRDDVAARARCERNQGRGLERNRFERVGFNYRMSELHAALGRAQLARLDEILARRRRAGALYRELLEGVPGVRPLPEVPGASPFVFIIRAETPRLRDDLREGLRRRGIETGVYFPPIHLEPPYRQRFGFRPGQFPASEDAARILLALPFFTSLPDEAVERVVRAIGEISGRGSA